MGSTPRSSSRKKRRFLHFQKGVALCCVYRQKESAYFSGGKQMLSPFLSGIALNTPTVRTMCPRGRRVRVYSGMPKNHLDRDPLFREIQQPPGNKTKSIGPVEAMDDLHPPFGFSSSVPFSPEVFSSGLRSSPSVSSGGVEDAFVSALIDYMQGKVKTAKGKEYYAPFKA